LFIPKYKATSHKCVMFMIALAISFVANAYVSECFGQSSCVFVDYQPVVCSNEPVHFGLKSKGTCTADEITWIFYNTQNSIDTLTGIGPHEVTFVKPGWTKFSIDYEDVELQTHIHHMDSFNVIEPVKEISIEPQNPCVGEVVKLKTEGVSKGFFVWKGASINPLVRGENMFEITDSIETENPQYSLQWYLGTNGTDRGCSFKYYDFTINTVEMSPLNIHPSNDINICQGDIIDLKVTDASNYDYLWQGENLFVNNTSLSLKPAQSTNITVSTFDRNNCFRSENVKINVRQVPSFTIEPAHATICEGNNLKLNIVTNNYFENEISYTWQGGTVQPLNTFNDVVEVIPTETTTYYATWEYRGCVASASSTIETSENVTDIFGDEIINICSGESVDLKVYPPGNGTVKWYQDDFENSIEGSSITVSPDKTTTYDVYWTDGTDGFCSDSGTVKVIVNPKPNLEITGIRGNKVCKGDTVTLQVKFTNGSFNENFRWNIKKTQEFLKSTNTQLRFTATQSTDITTVWVDSENVCTEVVSNNIYVEVLTKPEFITLETEADKKEICEGEAITFKVGGADLNNFILYDVDTKTIVHDKFEDSSVTITPVKTTNYVAQWLNNECEITSDTVKITVNDIPSIEVNNNKKICPNSEFEISIQPTDYSLYLWSGGDIPDSYLVTTTNLRRTEVRGNNFNYSLRISDNNCVFDTLFTLDLVDLDINTVSDTPDNEVCSGESAQLSVEGADLYLWDSNEILSGDLSRYPVATPTENSTKLNVTAYKDGCVVNDSIELYLKEKPEAIITIDENNAICPGDTVQLSGNGGQGYSWQPNSFLSNSQTQNPISIPTESVTYNLTVAAENGCTDEASVAVNVQDDGCEIDLNKIFVPNTFTPNGDNINDAWEIPAIFNLPDYLVTVFTDFGAVVFSKAGYQNEFNGINSGRRLPEGTYYYIIQHLNSQNKKTGTLTIIR